MSRRRRKTPRTFHIAWIFVICIAPVMVSYLLIPRDLEMAERLATDGHRERALSMLKELLPREIGQPIKSEDGFWEYPAMKTLLIKDGGERKRGGKKTRMLRILVQLCQKPESAFELFSSNSQALSPEVAQDFYNILATTSLRQNNPALASEIYLSLNKDHGLNDEQMMAAIQACRFSGSPKPALDLLHNYAAKKGVAVSDLSQELRLLVIALHRELNEGAKAFALLKVEFENAKTEQQRKEMIDLLATTAAQSNLFTESLPLLRAHVAKTEASKLSWEELALRPKPHSSDDEFVKFGNTLAQQFLWSGKLNPSLEMYRKLALLGDEEALEKCVLITPWVNRRKDLGRLLAALDSFPSGKGYEKLLVDSLCLDGEFSMAETRLRRWISEGHPDKADMQQTLADLVFELRRYDEANELYKAALDSRTEDSKTKLVDSLASRARTAVIAGDFEIALASYRKIPKDQHSLKTMGDYQILARSMNSFEDILRGLEVELELELLKNKPPTSQIYLSIAGEAETAGKLDMAQNFLQKGLKACPDSKKIVLKATEIFRKRGRHNDALEFLYRHYRKDDVRFHSRILDLAVSTKRQKEVLDFLKLEDPRAEKWPPALRLSLAGVYESSLDYKTALEIYENVSPDGFVGTKKRLQAQIAYHRGDVKDAWELQRAYLAMTSHPSHDELIFMGDLHRFTGRPVEAAQAYNAALSSLNRTISLDSATSKSQNQSSNF